MRFKRFFVSLRKKLSDLSYVGFFGAQAIRMLRESWDGTIPVTKDPVSQEQQVRPQGADLLAQEIFSMLNDNTPQTQNAPVTINQAGGAVGLTLNSSGSNVDPAVFNVVGGNISMAGTGTVAIGVSSTSTTTGSTVVLSGGNLVIPPIGQITLAATNYDPLSPTPLPQLNLSTLGVANPGQVFMGRVLSGSGSTYTLSLAGITGNVTATVPSVGTGYNIPVDTYAPVVVTDDGLGGVSYSFQPYPFAPVEISGARQSAASGGGLTNLLSGLATNHLIVNSTTDSPQTVTADVQDLTATGSVAKIHAALKNLGYIDGTISNNPPVISGFIGSVAVGGGIYNLLTGLQYYGMITNSVSVTPTTITGNRSDLSATGALGHLLTALSSLGLIVDGTL